MKYTPLLCIGLAGCVFDTGSMAGGGPGFPSVSWDGASDDGTVALLDAGLSAAPDAKPDPDAAAGGEPDGDGSAGVGGPGGGSGAAGGGAGDASDPDAATPDAGSAGALAEDAGVDAGDPPPPTELATCARCDGNTTPCAAGHSCVYLVLGWLERYCLPDVPAEGACSDVCPGLPTASADGSCRPETVSACSCD